MFIFQFLNDEMHNYVKQNLIAHFLIQKLKNKQTFLKNIQTEKAEETLILTYREETKTRYFVPNSFLRLAFSFIFRLPSATSSFNFNLLVSRCFSISEMVLWLFSNSFLLTIRCCLFCLI